MPPFRIRDFYDPGWFYAQLGTSGRTFLRENAPRLIPARRPRQVAIEEISKATLPDDQRAKLEEWLYYAYHGEISKVERTGAWETVCTLACEWSRWPGQGKADAPGISITALGYMPAESWKELANQCREGVRDWYLGRVSGIDAALKTLASKCAPPADGRGQLSKVRARDRHQWRRRIERWSHGEYSIELRPVPVRGTTDEQSAVFLIMERDTEGPLSVTQFRSQ